MSALVNRPTLSEADIPPLVRRLYGLDVIVRKELDSYDDQNFLVDVIPGSPLPPQLTCGLPNGCIFKVINALDSAKPEVLSIQTEIITHVNRTGYPTPGLVPTLKGKYQEYLDLPDPNSQGTKSYGARLLNFIPGKTLDQVVLTTDLCFQIGWFAGKMDVILKDFPTQNKPVLSSLTRKWNMSEIPKLKNKLHFVTIREQRTLIEQIIQQFETNVICHQDQFSKGLIHSDFNDCNILVTDRIPATNKSTDDIYKLITQENGDVPDFKSFTDTTCCSTDHAKGVSIDNSKVSQHTPFHVCGIIDFGDTTLSLYLFEVCIAISYTMINIHSIPPTEAAHNVLKGYLQHIHLSDSELDHLKLCICTRLVQSLVLGYVSSSMDPGNDYILVHARRIWPVLKSLWETPDLEFLAQLINGP